MKRFKSLLYALALALALTVGTAPAFAASPYVVTLSTVDPMGGGLPFTQSAAPAIASGRLLSIYLTNTSGTGDTVYLLKDCTTTVLCSTYTAVYVSSTSTTQLNFNPDLPLSNIYLRKQSTASTIIGTVRYR